MLLDKITKIKLVIKRLKNKDIKDQIKELQKL